MTGTDTSRRIAVYGKGGIGKSTIISNLAVVFGQRGMRVLLVGCDPKHDTTYKVSDVYPIPTVLGRYQERGERISVEEFLFEGRCGVRCVEAGGPEPGVGCAGRGITKMFELFEAAGLDLNHNDVVLFDVLGDVVCGGFAGPMRAIRNTEVVIVVSGEIMALYAANNLCRAIARLSRSGVRLSGLVGNLRGVAQEEEILKSFAARLGTRLLACIPGDPLVPRAERERRTVCEFAPSSDLAARYRALAEDLLATRREDLVTPRFMSDLGFDCFVREALERDGSQASEE